MSKSVSFQVSPLPGASFGGLVQFRDDEDAEALIAKVEATPDEVLDAFYDVNCLLVFKGLHAFSDKPNLLVRLSHVFGEEVEDYRQTLTDPANIHPDFPEILVVSNIFPVVPRVPVRPTPPLTANGSLPVRFPHRRGWHTDQSFRRPPPDISLFYAETPAPKGQGQTLYADGIGAYEALNSETKQRIQHLEGLHISPGKGRAEYSVKAGEKPAVLGHQERPQPQPVVRVHPVTAKRALFLCEAGQMDWVEGPIIGMERGIDGDGARLVYELMAHYTAPEFTYVHEWDVGDLVIYDNRSTIHSATWYDAESVQRRMWRTTVWGNPGPLYDGESRSWIA